VTKKQWCDESTPKRKKTPTDEINQKSIAVIFPLLILGIFFIFTERTNGVSRVRALILVVISLQIYFSVLLEGLQMLYASHSLQKLLRSALQNIKKGIEFSFSQDH